MFNRLQLFFLSPFSAETDRHYFRARLMVKFALVSAMVSLGLWISTFFTGFIVARFLTLGSSVMFFILLFGLRARVSLRLVCWLFVIYCSLIIFALSLFSGGIHSVALPWISLIPVTALLLMGEREGLIGGSIALSIVLFFSFAADSLTVSEALQGEQSNVRAASLYIGLVVLTLSITYIFHRQGAELLGTVQQQNRELDLAREKLEKQRDEIAVNNENLEAEVEKRTHELLEYNQQLEQFAFIASHNLRAPVATLLGLGHLLEVSTGGKEEVEQISQSMMTTARELDRVVRDLSTILEIRKSTQAVLSEINLDDEVRLVSVSLDRELKETGAKLKTDFSQVPFLVTVRPLLDSILMNLISNAMKYRHPDRTPVIEVKAIRKGDEVCLSVRDNGLGIDLDAYGDKLFTLYGRFHSHVDGKGLGLYLIKTHAMAMGGKVEVESKPDHGTTFLVFLPHRVPS